MNMNVLIDTNIYIADPSLSSPEFAALRNYLEKTNSKLLIPQVVSDEVDKNLHAKAYALSRELNGHLAYRMGLLKQTQIKKEKLAEQLKVRFERLKQVMPVEVLDLKDVQIETMVQKSLLERAPFKSSSKGFRDAVIWEVLLKYLSRTDESVGFITNNTKDFGKDVLLPSLIDDLTEIGARHRAFYKTDLRSFLTEFSNTLDFITLEFITQALELDLIGIGETVDPQKVETLSDDTQHYVVVKADYYDYEIEDYYIIDEKLESVTVYVNARLNFTVDVEFLMDENYNFLMSTDVYSSGSIDSDLGWLDVSITLEVDREAQFIIDKVIDV